MNIPEKALELARQGGWDITDGHGYFEAIALDKDFWIGLSKALGWNTSRYEPVVKERYEWEENAHRLYDLILTGGDAEKYWKDLLT